MPTPNPPQPIRTFAATIALGLILAVTTTTPAHAATSTSSATTDLITSIQTLIDTITNTAADETPDPNPPAPQATTPTTPYFLAANFPKITGDPESIHQVAFSYLRNTDGSLTPITDGRWFGTIGGKKLADFTPTSTTPVLAINVREADLKNITITHTTPEGIKTTLAVVDPQLSREAQTTLFVPTE